MTVLMVAIWLALQIPAGSLLGRSLQRRPIPVPIAATPARPRLIAT